MPRSTSSALSRVATRRARRTRVAGLVLAITTAGAAPLVAQAPASPPDAAKPYSFVVLGHVRGDRSGPNPKLGELLDKVRVLHPDFAVLTGDMIWGEMDINPSDKKVLNQDWGVLDSALATLRIPIYRVPGNHDISDIASRDVYNTRYGKLPQAVTVGSSRLLLLRSVWAPADTDKRKMPYFRMTALDTEHLQFLKTELAKPGFAHTFVFLHDIIWWQPDSTQWWREVHPMLKNARVDAVFSGDLGPMKFSTRTRDSVSYFQSSMETKPPVQMLRDLPSSRLLSSQFDNFLEVRVDGPKVTVNVHTLAEISGGMFTPDVFNEASLPAIKPPPVPAWRLAWNAVNSPKRIAALLVAFFGGCTLLFYAGMVAGRRRR